MVVSFFLMLLFGVAVATITGIGGPGQSVGDMFYATWLTFLVTIGVVIVCYTEISKEEDGAVHSKPSNSEPHIDAQTSILEKPGIISRAL